MDQSYYFNVVRELSILFSSEHIERYYRVCCGAKSYLNHIQPHTPLRSTTKEKPLSPTPPNVKSIYTHNRNNITTNMVPPSRPKTLNFITGNANKLAEVKAILALDQGDAEVELKSQALDLPELQGTIEEISVDKARRAAELVSKVSCAVFVVVLPVNFVCADLFLISSCDSCFIRPP